jgi:hypothetical protein
MLDLNELLRTPGLRPASGYRDPVTKEFVRMTQERREKTGLSDSCFLRNS